MKKAWHGSLIALFAFALLVVQASLPARADDDATWLKTKHRAFAGYTFGDGTIRSISYDENVMKDGQKNPLSVSHVKRAGLAYRIDTSHVKENQTDFAGFTGSVFWYSDESGQTTKLGGNTVSPNYGWDLVWTDAIATLHWAYLKTVTEHGATLAIVRTALNSGMPIILYVDTNTGAYERAVIDAGGDYQQDLRFDNYSEPVPGIHFPSKYHFDRENGFVTLGSVAVNPIISDADLHPPIQTAHWTFGSSAPLPIELTKERIVIHAKVNGVDGRFLLDTGADSIYLSGTFARRAKLVASGHSALESLYGSEKTDVGTADVQLGDNTLHSVTLYFGMADSDTQGPDGMLGYGLFASTNLMIDFDNRTMTIGDAQPVVAEGDIAIPASFANGQPSIPMMLDKRIPFDVMLDTGNPEGVVFPVGLLSEYGLHLYSGKHGEGYTCGDLDPLTLGTFVYQTPYGCASDGSGRWILAGLDFLRTFHSVDFDYLHGNVIFVPKPKR